MSSFYISDDKTKLDLALIHDFLSNRSYWAQGRTMETVEKSIAHSICLGVYNQEHKQVGFARIATDYAIFAWLMDVFILEDYRGQGLSKLLIKEVMAHPDLQGLKRWGLVTADAHSLYQQFGFTPLEKPERMMEKLL
ncbi:Acetyltransferase (GNAT) domain-containing protein [Chitinophaga sp. CF118]|uniref:GNAT family N-acetyltransferase n=1 Tax=Chitinophaga sp. CF118 TaxID=1884367 RepID=UPI0008EA5A39|nr:GNAT family N-acetyltransferase [Chitinophaga sp. CF118]SFD61761.1 Acetyltransferase (GNAT) domain-containing protein [Chitinophaga sp. CF118]